MNARRSHDSEPAGPRREGLHYNPFAALSGDGKSVPPSVVPPAADPVLDRGAPVGAAGDRIVVRREKKGRGGKAVTIAEGAGLAGADLEALAREAAKALGTGARVEEGALVVQGEQTDRLIAWLVARGFASVTRGN